MISKKAVTDDRLTNKFTGMIGTLRELLKMQDFELPFRVKPICNEEVYELQTIRGNFVYFEIFKNGRSVDFDRFEINDSKKYILL